jgi:hypothetical protein
MSLRYLGEQTLIVIPGVDVQRYRAVGRNLADTEASAVEQLPHSFVAV